MVSRTCGHSTGLERAGSLGRVTDCWAGLCDNRSTGIQDGVDENTSACLADGGAGADTYRNVVVFLMGRWIAQWQRCDGAELSGIRTIDVLVQQTRENMCCGGLDVCRAGSEMCCLTHNVAYSLQRSLFNDCSGSFVTWRGFVH